MLEQSERRFTIEPRPGVAAAWGLAAALALLWPDHVASPLDGVPLDRPAEAILIGLVFPALWWFDPGFLGTRRARVLIVLLALWKACSSAVFAQEGWCVRFEPARRYVKDQTGAPHAWDLRADWRSPDPACSAIMTRAYGSFAEFPAWFFNLPPPNDSWPGPADRPPGAVTRMTVTGFVQTRAAGLLRIDKGSDMAAALSVDGGRAGGDPELAAGRHIVVVDAKLTGKDWRLEPLWNGGDLWTGVIATATKPRPMDLALRPAIRWLPIVLAGSLLAVWFGSAIARAGDVWLVVWTAAASLVIAGLAVTGSVAPARWAIAALACAAVLPVRRRVRDVPGAFLAVGVPWLAFVAARAAPAAGHFVLYDWGHDFWMFQRYAYRIVMQGYWLEGGSPTFWFQPFYRWIAGVLHLAFGDSSIGEWFWDGSCLLAGSLFAFRIASTFAGSGWGIVAATLPLAAFVLGTPDYLIGRGLSEISSAGFVYLAALCVLGSADGRLRLAAAAGLFAVLAFYTRLNNLPMAAGLVALTIPLDVPARAVLRPWQWRARVSWATAAAIAGSLATGALLFAWRTWHYTGVFSLFYGTQRDYLALWQPGMSVGTVLSRIAESVLMVLTVNDPPRFDVYALPVLGGAASCVLAAVGVPRLRDLPLSLVLFFFASIAGAFVTRGTAYPGRFSVHVIPVTCAALTCAAASLTSVRGEMLRSGPATAFSGSPARPISCVDQPQRTPRTQRINL